MISRWPGFLGLVPLLWGCGAPAPAASAPSPAPSAAPPPATFQVVDSFPPPLQPSIPEETAKGEPASPDVTKTPGVPSADVNDSLAHFRVPIGSSPVDGKADALVTLVIFGGYQDPFSRRLIQTVAELKKQVGDELRIVWKDRPLPFHPRAQPSLRLARAVFASGGGKSFWQAHAALMDTSNNLDEPSLLKVGQKFGIFGAKARKTLATPAPALDEDVALGDALMVQGTPASFINGRRLVGAQALENFHRLIMEEMQVAQALVANGTPKKDVYEVMQRDAAVIARRTEPQISPAKVGAGGAGATAKPPAPPSAPTGNPPATSETIEAQHLLIAYKGASRASAAIQRSKAEAKQRAIQALNRLQKGGDFDEVVRQFTDEPGGKERAGVLGSFRRGMMVPEFETAAFALKVNEISGVIETPFGFHLIRRTK